MYNTPTNSASRSFRLISLEKRARRLVSKNSREMRESEMKRRPLACFFSFFFLLRSTSVLRSVSLVISRYGCILLHRCWPAWRRKEKNQARVKRRWRIIIFFFAGFKMTRRRCSGVSTFKSYLRFLIQFVGAIIGTFSTVKVHRYRLDSLPHP